MQLVYIKTGHLVKNLETTVWLLPLNIFELNFYLTMTKDNTKFVLPVSDAKAKYTITSIKFQKITL